MAAPPPSPRRSPPSPQLSPLRPRWSPSHHTGPVSGHKRRGEPLTLSPSHPPRRSASSPAALAAALAPVLAAGGEAAALPAALAPALAAAPPAGGEVGEARAPPPLLVMLSNPVVVTTLLPCLELTTASPLVELHPVGAATVAAARWTWTTRSGGIIRLPLVPAAVAALGARFPAAAFPLELTLDMSGRYATTRRAVASAWSDANHAKVVADNADRAAARAAAPAAAPAVALAADLAVAEPQNAEERAARLLQLRRAALRARLAAHAAATAARELDESTRAGLDAVAAADAQRAAAAAAVMCPALPHVREVRLLITRPLRVVPRTAEGDAAATVAAATALTRVVAALPRSLTALYVCDDDGTRDVHADGAWGAVSDDAAPQRGEPASWLHDATRPYVARGAFTSYGADGEAGGAEAGGAGAGGAEVGAAVGDAAVCDTAVSDADGSDADGSDAVVAAIGAALGLSAATTDTLHDERDALETAGGGGAGAYDDETAAYEASYRYDMLHVLALPPPLLGIDLAAVPRDLATLVVDATVVLGGALPPNLVALCAATYFDPRATALSGCRVLRDLRLRDCLAFNDGALAALPPTLEHLELDTCGLTRAAAFGHLPRLAAAALYHMPLDGRALRSLPPTLAALGVSPTLRYDVDADEDVGEEVGDAAPEVVAAAIALTAAAVAAELEARTLTVDHLPRLTTLEVRGDARVTSATFASLPPCLTALTYAPTRTMVDAAALTPAYMRHLTRLATVRLALQNHTPFGAADAARDWSAVVAALPPTVTTLDMHGNDFCPRAPAEPPGADGADARRADPFAHLTALRVLDVSGTTYRRGMWITAERLARLPTSLRALRIAYATEFTSPAASLAHLRELRVLDARGTAMRVEVAASLPPCLEALHMGGCHTMHRDMRLEDLLASRLARDDARDNRDYERGYDGDGVPCAPPLTMAGALARLTALRALTVDETPFGKAELAALPPTLEYLSVSHCTNLSAMRSCNDGGAVFSHLPNLRVLRMRGLGFTAAMLASLPRDLRALCMAFCHRVTLRSAAIGGGDAAGGAGGGAGGGAAAAGADAVAAAQRSPWAALARFTALRALNVAGSDADNGVLAALSRTVTQLRTKGCGITHGALAAWAHRATGVAAGLLDATVPAPMTAAAVSLA